MDEGRGENHSQDTDMRTWNISYRAIKKAMASLVVISAASFLVFFIIGFIFYTPPESESVYDSITMPIERASDKSIPATADTGQAGEKKEHGQFSNVTERLPLLNERRGKVRVAKKYKGLLAQMGSILEEDIDSLQVSNAAEDLREGLVSIEVNAAYEGVSAGGPIKKTIRERMMMIADVLEYASTQTGISVDLLAAVAWAESKMLPYAINVRGKAYYFISRERALEALRGLETDEVDIGLFQVNYRLWGEPLGLQKEDLLDSRVCAIIGAMILRYNLQRHRDPWVAIGRYHSGNTRRMRAYQTKVSRGLMLIRMLSMTSDTSEGSKLHGVSRVIRKNPAFRREARLDS